MKGQSGVWIPHKISELGASNQKFQQQGLGAYPEAHVGGVDIKNSGQRNKSKNVSRMCRVKIRLLFLQVIQMLGNQDKQEPALKLILLLHQFKSHCMLKEFSSKYKMGLTKSRLLNGLGCEGQRNAGIRNNQIIYSRALLLDLFQQGYFLFLKYISVMAQCLQTLCHMRRSV